MNYYYYFRDAAADCLAENDHDRRRSYRDNTRRRFAVDLGHDAMVVRCRDPVVGIGASTLCCGRQAIVH